MCFCDVTRPLGIGTRLDHTAGGGGGGGREGRRVGHAPEPLPFPLPSSLNFLFFSFSGLVSLLFLIRFTSFPAVFLLSSYSVFFRFSSHLFSFFLPSPSPLFSFHSFLPRPSSSLTSPSTLPLSFPSSLPLSSSYPPPSLPCPSTSSSFPFRHSSLPLPPLIILPSLLPLPFPLLPLFPPLFPSYKDISPTPRPPLHTHTYTHTLPTPTHTLTSFFTCSAMTSSTEQYDLPGAPMTSQRRRGVVMFTLCLRCSNTVIVALTLR